MPAAAPTGLAGAPAGMATSDAPHRAAAAPAASAGSPGGNPPGTLSSGEKLIANIGAASARAGSSAQELETDAIGSVLSFVASGEVG
jgi:hypothetical protein